MRPTLMVAAAARVRRPVTVAPGQVTGLLAVGSTVSSVDLDWDAPAGGPSDYRVEYKLTSSGVWLTFADGVSAATAATVTGLVSDAAYNFRVTALNSAGEGAPSATVTFSTQTPAPSVPGQVANVAVNTITDSSMVVSWTAPSGAPTDYSVEFKRAVDSSWSVFADGVSTAVSVNVTGLQPSTQYNFRVRAQNAAGFGAYSATVTFTTSAAPPGQVTGLTVGTIAPTSVALSWTATPGGVTDYRVEFKPASSANWSVFADGTSATNSTTVTGLAQSTAYNFRVAAINLGGQGPYSATANATTTSSLPAAPGQVTGLTAGTATSSSVPLSWTAPSTGGAVADYDVEFKLSSASTWLTFADAVTANANTVVNGLQPSTAYDFRVRARNAGGTGAYSSTVSRTTTAAANAGSFMFPGPANALWKQPIPTTASYRSASDASCVRVRTKMGTLYPNHIRFTNAVYVATSSTPLVDVYVDPFYARHEGRVFRPGVARVPLDVNTMGPDPGRNYWPFIGGTGAAAGTQTSGDPYDPRGENSNRNAGAGIGPGQVSHNYDGHISILDANGRTMHDFWHLWREPSSGRTNFDLVVGRLYATSYARWDIIDDDGFYFCGARCLQLYGNDHPSVAQGRPLTYGWASQRAAGCSSVPMLIRPGEMDSGAGPEHCIAFLCEKSHQYYNGGWTDYTEGVNIKVPASKADTAGGTADSAGLPGSSRLRHGQLIAIPRNLTADGIGLSQNVYSRRLFYTLQKYGARNVDQAGSGGVGFFINFDRNGATAAGAALAAQTSDLQKITANLVLVDWPS